MTRIELPSVMFGLWITEYGESPPMKVEEYRTPLDHSVVSVMIW